MKVLGDSLGRPISIITLALCALGIIAVLSASCTTGASDPRCGFDSLYFVKRQGISCILGLIFLVCTRRYIDLDKTRWLMTWPAMCLCLGMSIAMLFFPAQNYAHRWITIGPINIQVGEICKVVFICYWADVLARIYNQLGKGDKDIPEGCPWYKKALTSFVREVRFFFWPAIFSGLIMGIIESGRDMGTVMLLCGIVLAMLSISGFPFHIVLKMFGLLMVAATAMVLMRDYRIARVLAWIHPDDFADGPAYQVINSFFAISSGGAWGRGLAMSGQKYGFLPEQHTDFIYSIVCEEIGFVGSMGLMTLFALLCYCGFKLSSRCKDPYRALLAFGISFQLGAQALINLLMVTGLIPNKGLPLPFISYGGSSLCVTLFSVGILLNISDTFRNTGLKQRKKTIPVRRAVRRAHSLSNSRVPYPSSSSEVITSPISSGEWRSIVESDAATRKRKLPEPRVNAGWNRVIAIDRSMRERRERLRSQRKLL